MEKKSWKNMTALLAFTGLLLSASPLAADIDIGVVDFKVCVEKSKQGKEEQESFDKMKVQMESVLAEKEKVLTDLAQKLQDPDYLDSISAEAETEMKRKFRTLSQEMSQLQQQYYQVLQQAHYKVVQQINELISEASKTVAADGGLDLILNDENTYYASKALDVTEKVIAEMDKNFSEKPKEEDENALKGMFPGK